LSFLDTEVEVLAGDASAPDFDAIMLQEFFN
jgi:hypothetical protein